MHLLHFRVPGLLGLVLCATSVPALAQSTPDSSDADDAQVAFVAAPTDAATLDTTRGGAQWVSSEMTLSGSTADNSAHHITTGTNTIDSGAFSNMNGLPMVIQNSGANVLIQNATIVHVEMN